MVVKISRTVFSNNHFIPFMGLGLFNGLYKTIGPFKEVYTVM